MSDSAALFGIALIEAGKAMSAQAASVRVAQEGHHDHIQPLLSRIDTINQSLSAVEGHLASVNVSVNTIFTQPFPTTCVVPFRASLMQ